MIYNIKTNYIQGEPPSSSDLNRRGLILESQLAGALEVFEAGIVEGFAVSAGVGGYLATAGMALIRAGEGTLVLAESAAALAIGGIVPGEINYVHLALAIPELPGQAETVLGDPPLLLVSPDEELPDCLLLAEVSAAGAVTDRRVVVNVRQLLADVGYDTDARILGTVDERLRALEGAVTSGGGGEGGGYWGSLERSLADPTTIAQFVAQQLADFATQGQSVLAATPRDETTVNVLHSLAMHQQYHNDAFTQIPPHHAFVVSPGRGTGSWTSAEFTDEALTTMPMDEVNHVFGQL